MHWLVHLCIYQRRSASSLPASMYVWVCLTHTEHTLGVMRTALSMLCSSADILAEGITDIKRWPPCQPGVIASHAL